MIDLLLIVLGVAAVICLWLFAAYLMGLLLGVVLGVYWFVKDCVCFLYGRLNVGRSPSV